MTDYANPDLSDPAVRAQLGIEERTEGGPPDLQGPQAQPQGALKNLRAALEKETKENSDLASQLAQAQRELALTKANLPDFAGKQFFIDNYAGETTPDAIRAAAEAAGFKLDEAAPETKTSPVTAQELAQHRQVAQVAAGSGPGGDIDLNDALLAARSPDEVLSILRQSPMADRVKPNIA